MSTQAPAPFKFEPAKREGIKLLCGLFGKSGGGKSRSALMLARGIVGPQGRIGLIDSERRRGSIFADLIPGGYQTLDLDEPFTPERYIEAFKVAEKTMDIVIVDQISAEWSGEGGVLEMQEEELQRMAGSDYKKRESCKMAAWIGPKTRHAKFVRTILRSTIPVICIMRGKDKTHMVKDPNGGKTKVITDEFSSPIYDADFIYELLLCGEVYQRDGIGGFFRPEKITHPAVGDLIPRDGEQFTIEHGAKLAAWAAGGGGPKPQTVSQPSNTSDGIAGQCKRLRATLWSMVKSKFQNGGQLTNWLIEEAIMSDSEVLEDMGVSRLNQIIDKVKANPPQ